MTTKILDTAQVRAKIAGLKQSAATQRANIHAVCVALVGHALRYGSSPLATLLLASVGSGVNQNGIMAWLDEYGPFSCDRGSKDVAFSKKKRAAFGIGQDEITKIEAKLAELEAGPQWWETKAKKAEAVAEYDVLAELDKLIKKAAAKKADADTECKNGNLVQYLQAIRVKYISDEALFEAQRASRAAEEAKKQAERTVDAEPSGEVQEPVLVH